MQEEQEQEPWQQHEQEKEQESLEQKWDVEEPRMGLFDVLRSLPPDVVTSNLLHRLGVRERCALRLLAREQRSLYKRHTAAVQLQVAHRRIERMVWPNTSNRLLEMPPIVVDEAPPLHEALQLTLGSFGRRLRRLHLSSDAAPVTELDLDMISVLVPELEELVLRFDVWERPAPVLDSLGGLLRLRRLALQLGSSKLNYDPAPEVMVRSLSRLTGLRALSLELTATTLPLPARELERLTSLRLALVFRGYGAGQQSEQLRSLVSQLALLTELRALAVPDGYRGSDGDLLRAASPVLPSLTALHMPRLSCTRPELEVSELEVVDGLSGAHPASSPVFLLHLAGALEALPRLRRLAFASAAPQSDALVQGLPGLLVALRRPLRVEASFLGHADAARLRSMLAEVRRANRSSLSPAQPGSSASTRRDGAEHEGVEDVVVLASEEPGVGLQESPSAPSGREARDCSGGWAAGGGLWWLGEEDGAPAV
ncbi:hypothetical protein GPECTOR_3g308 [Gonium pectorale]|uniref:Uncharacterized protein n=1 Tax=Gonium pectorale TaxID=33097 RepID=A0A150H0R9_GONPE|nr:hypothetical protein GPECTOR_3g308 [Gonium pectorale]|eukprot:KXZ55160.1 hypothetical protein GPECTOR_3g308 [Gonium pectorale]